MYFTRKEDQSFLVEFQMKEEPFNEYFCSLNIKQNGLEVNKLSENIVKFESNGTKFAVGNIMYINEPTDTDNDAVNIQINLWKVTEEVKHLTAEVRNQ